jgi:heme A synthase
MEKKDNAQIKSQFWKRQGRQLLAIAIALFLIILMAVVYKRHDLFGEYSGKALVVAQLVVLIVFIGFTAVNWRCPACNKYLGKDINKRICRHCKARLR